MDLRQKESLRNRLKVLESKYNFTQGEVVFNFRNGDLVTDYSQVVGRGEEVNRAFGEYTCIQYILDTTF